ncbi:MAG: hypothetical protein BMS9Abin29_0912 [Gemmatimonadota bacterium]|nr:MAG: hypothetical protein BMS9Abin29_0912 [Gemmatimonadota bacterium]
MKQWRTLGAFPPEGLVASRLELHHAVQLLASFGQTLLDPRPDDSHRSMVWFGPDQGFSTSPMEREPSLRMTLAPADLTASVHGDAGVLVSRSLVGLTPDEAYGWLESELPGALARDGLRLARPEYEIPARGSGRGVPFSGTPAAALVELEAWFENAADLLDELVAQHASATGVRCWPHHFDIATLLVLDPEIGPADGRSVGVGFSPGDEATPQPYWYVTPYPDPGTYDLPDLPGGYWNTEGWFGAVLPGSAVVAAGSAADQASLTATFVREAVSAGMVVLGG